MSNYVYCKEEDLIAIADAIRTKTGGTEVYKLWQLPDAILNIVSSEVTNIPTYVTCTGDHTLSTIEINGIQYNMMTLTKTANIAIDGPGAKIWICGGGAGGQKGYKSGDYNYGMAGGGGGYVNTINKISSGSYLVTIGAAGGRAANGGTSSVTNTSTNEIIASANGGNKNGDGGSAGGNQVRINFTYYYTIETVYEPKGAGVTTYPFGSIQFQPHCAGGGSANAEMTFVVNAGGITNTHGTARGCIGGSNGSDSGAAYNPGSFVYEPVPGGNYGGGNSGYINGLNPGAVYAGTAATFYGGGGGGGASYYNEEYYIDDNPPLYGNGGAGYQGVAYVIWPVITTEE